MYACLLGSVQLPSVFTSQGQRDAATMKRPAAAPSVSLTDCGASQPTARLRRASGSPVDGITFQSAEGLRRSSGWLGQAQAEHIAEFHVVDGQVGVVRPLEISAHDAQKSVIELTRLGADLCRVKAADDSILVLDAAAVKTLPDGMARLGALQAREAAAQVR